MGIFKRVVEAVVYGGPERDTQADENEMSRRVDEAVAARQRKILEKAVNKASKDNRRS